MINKLDTVSRKLIKKSYGILFNGLENFVFYEDH
jgi:hypothetical protein